MYLWLSRIYDLVGTLGSDKFNVMRFLSLSLESSNGTVIVYYLCLLDTVLCTIRPCGFRSAGLQCRVKVLYT